MTMTITNPSTGLPISVFVTDGGGFIDALIRATDKATWEAVAVANKLLVAGDQGVLHAAPGVSIDMLGPITKPDPASTMANPKPPIVKDPMYHVNLRIDKSLPWEALALAWALHGTLDPTPDNAEHAVAYQGIELIDPASIKTPSRVWA